MMLLVLQRYGAAPAVTHSKGWPDKHPPTPTHQHHRKNTNTDTTNTNTTE
jgi:hypothetical protein